MDAEMIYGYAKRYAELSVRSGRGTRYPTVRLAARRFRCRQSEIVEMVEQSDASFIPGADYFGLSVGVQMGGGGGYATYDAVGDYEIEAY